MATLGRDARGVAAATLALRVVIVGRGAAVILVATGGVVVRASGLMAGRGAVLATGLMARGVAECEVVARGIIISINWPCERVGVVLTVTD